MRRPALLAAAALGAAAVGCTDPAAPAETIGFRQPSALAVFRGVTHDDGGQAVRPYLAVANAARNDLTLVDAGDDTAVWAPVQLRAATVPVAERPALLAAASLGDDDPTDPLDGADLLVAVSAGDSALQLVRTWTADTAVVAEVDLAVELGLGAVEIVAVSAVPSAAGTARVAAALSNRRVALVTFARGGDGSIAASGPPVVSAELPFQPLALAAMPGPADQTAIYAATADALAPGVYGVAELSADLATVRALDARGPTRLVAALRLAERDPASSAADSSAFTNREVVPRVYAVLDETGCGDGRRVACGVVTLDPVSGAIPPDASGAMPYRAPLPIGGRPLALAVAPPPAQPPAPELPQYGGSFMRLMGGDLAQATTGVGLVASDDGNVYFLDLGRHKLATVGSALSELGASATAPAFVDGKRLWLQELGTEVFAPSPVAASRLPSEGPRVLDVTPGHTPTDQWIVSYQTALPDLSSRAAEAGAVVTGQLDRLWVAMQVGYGAGLFGEVVKLRHPALGARAGDIVQIAAAGVPGCATQVDPDDETRTVGVAFLEARVDAILEPGDAYPGGALAIVHDPSLHDAAALPLQARCFAELGNRIVAPDAPRPGVATGLAATVRAGGLLLTGFTAGYAGRPSLGADHVLAYQDEDALAERCPLAGWDGTYPVPLEARTCATAGACNEPVDCEALVLARKARRIHHGYEACDAADERCRVVAGDPVDPSGPALSFRVGVQPDPGGAAPELIPARDAAVTISTTSGVKPLSHGASAGSPYLPTSAIAFDRSTVSAGAGYRFLVSYSADLVLDVTPHVNPVDGIVVR